MHVIKQAILFCVLFVCFSDNHLFAQDTAAKDTLVSVKPDFSTMAKNTIYLELLGNGVYASLNYDRLMNVNWSLRAGFAYIPLNFLFPSPLSLSNANTTVSSILETTAYTVSLPLSASYLYNFSGTPSYLELGGGPTFVNLYASISGMTTSPTTMSQERVTVSGNYFLMMLGSIIGYRLQPQSGGFNFRIAATPFLALVNSITSSSQMGTMPVQQQTITSIRPFFPVVNFSAGISFGYTF